MVLFYVYILKLLKIKLELHKLGTFGIRQDYRAMTTIKRLYIEQKKKKYRANIITEFSVMILTIGMAQCHHCGQLSIYTY